MRDEPYFKPGDKVIRVTPGPVPGTYTGNDIPASPRLGVVYCVEDFFEGPHFNSVMLVGFGGWRYQNGLPVGWRAIHFRRVEEIKLCVAAVNHAKAPQENVEA